MITVKINTDNAAWCSGDTLGELEYVLAQVARAVDTEPCGPNGFMKTLLDSNGNTTGKVVVDNG